MKKILITSIIIFTFILSACSARNVEAQEHNVMNIDDIGYNYSSDIIIDEKTGVNYIFISTGFSNGGLAITPRLNGDGSLYVTKQ